MSRQEYLARVLNYTGLLRMAECIPREPYLVILNYHRIGNPAACPYDREVFSATVEGFRAQVTHMMRGHRVLSVSEIRNLHTTLHTLDEPAFMITFDDGYSDNYELAYPLLRHHGIPGVFFIPTIILDRQDLFWWDTVAFLVRNSRRHLIRYDPEKGRQVALGEHSCEQVIATILHDIKTRTTCDYDAYLEYLAKECAVDMGEVVEKSRLPLFLSGGMIKEMHQNGMVFGSHGHSHRLMSHLSMEEQETELVLSKEKLAEVLGDAPSLFSYPVGSRQSFTKATKIMVSRHYDSAFTYYGGLVRKDHMDWSEVPRESVDACDTVALLRARMQYLRYKRSPQ